MKKKENVNKNAFIEEVNELVSMGIMATFLGYLFNIFGTYIVDITKSIDSFLLNIGVVLISYYLFLSVYYKVMQGYKVKSCDNVKSTDLLDMVGYVFFIIPLLVHALIFGVKGYHGGIIILIIYQLLSLVYSNLLKSSEK